MKKNILKHDVLKRNGFVGKLLILILLMTFLFNKSLLAQCDLQIIKDDFSSSQIITSKEVTLASVFPLIGNKDPWSIEMNFTISNNNCVITVTHASQSISDDFSSIQFKFEDGEVITLDKPLTHEDMNSGTGYRYTMTYFPILHKHLIKFSNTDLLKFRAIFTYFPDYPVVEEDLKSKIIKQIRKDAGCILSEIDLNLENPQDESPVKCEYAKDDTDDFTKIRTVLTNPEVLFDIQLNEIARNWLTICGSNINGNRGIQVNRVMIFNTKGKIDEEGLKQLLKFDKIDLMLENDEIISLKEEPSEFISNGAKTYFSYKLYTIRDDTIWNKLGTIPVKKIKISMNDNELDRQDIEDKYQQSFIKAINCINSLNIPKPE